MTDKGIVVVTGAARGIGAAVARDLADSGHDVVAADIRPHTGAADPRITRRLVSVTDEAAVNALADEIAGTGQYVHGVVNAAGVLHTGTVAESTPEQWNELFSVNAFGVYLVSRAMVRVMVDQRDVDPKNRRSVVTVASNSAVVPRSGMAAYAASKAAAAHFTRSLGLEVATHGIRCNTVSPGTTRTTMLDQMWRGRDLEAEVVRGTQSTFKAGIPLGRIAEPADAAGVVMFLLSESARHVTLQEITVDGGASQR